MVKHISKIAYGSDVYYVKDVEARLNLIDKTEKGAANGIAELDSAGKVPSSQLPSYVDDVLEYSSQSDFPSTGEAGKIYIAKDTNKTYRWSGSAYTEISASLALGETSSTAYAGNKGKATTDAFNSHSSDTTIHVTSSEKTTWNGKQNAISDLSTIRSGASAGATAYLKPSSGIPKTDLASAVQTSLGKADSALQSHQTAETIATNLTSLGYKLTDTNTKVTSVSNHYAPAADSSAELTASLSGTAGAYAINTEYTVLTGVKAQRDAKGHVTGLTYTAQKVKDTNTNTTYSAGSGLSLSGTTFSLALTKALVTTALGYTPPTTNTTYSAFTGATVSDAGAAGLVPAPPKREAYGGGRLLFDDGTWDTPFITYAQYTTNGAHWQTFGYCPTAGGQSTHFNGILYGLGNYSTGEQGVYLIEFYKYSATVCSLIVTCLQLPSSISNLEFGYYDDGTNTYFGYTCTTRHRGLQLTPISTYKVTLADSGILTVAPTGWTAGSYKDIYSVTTTVTEPTSAKNWYPVFTTSSSTATTTTVTNPTGFFVSVLLGTTAAEGMSRLCIGNNVAAGTDGNKTGEILLYNNQGKNFKLQPHAGTTSNRTLALPNANGTLVAHTTDTAIGSSSEPVYVSAAGVATKCTALDATKLTGKITANNGVLINIDNSNKLTIAPKNNDTHTVRFISQVKILPVESHILEDVEDYSQDTEVDYLSIGHYTNSHKPYISIYDANASKLREVISMSDSNVLRIGLGLNDKVTQVYGKNVKLYSINNDNNSIEVFASTTGGNVRIGSGGDYTTYKLAVDGKVSGTSFTNTSDIRKKDVIDTIDINVGDIANAPIFKFTWLDPDMEQGVNVGTSAQYWRTVVPELITEGSDEEKTLSMQYGVAGLVSAVTIARKVVEQEKVIELQEARIKALEDAIAEIKSKLNN